MLKRGVEEEFEWRSGRGSGDLSNAVNAIVLDNSSCVRRLHTSLISGNKVSSPCVTCDISVAFFCESMFFFQILTNAYVFFPSSLFVLQRWIAVYNASLFVHLYISACKHRRRVCVIYLKSHCLKNWLGSKVALDVNIRGWDKWRDFLQCMHPLLIQSGSPRWRLKSGGNLAKLPTCLPAPGISSIVLKLRVSHYSRMWFLRWEKASASKPKKHIM